MATPADEQPLEKEAKETFSFKENILKKSLNLGLFSIAEQHLKRKAAFLFVSFLVNLINNSKQRLVLGKACLWFRLAERSCHLLPTKLIFSDQ